MSLNANTITTKGLVIQGLVTAAGLAISGALLGLFDSTVPWRDRAGKIAVAVIVVVAVSLLVQYVLRDPVPGAINNNVIVTTAAPKEVNNHSLIDPEDVSWDSQF